MTKPHRLQKLCLSSLPSRLTPVILTCALGLTAQAQVRPPAAVAPPDATEATANTETEANAEPEATAAAEAAAANEADKRAADKALGTDAPQAGQGPEAKDEKTPPTSDARSGQQGYDFQSQRIKPRTFNVPPQMQDAAARARARQKRLEMIVRGVMSQVGFTDEPMQQYIAAHMANEDQARGPLRKKGEQLFLALKSVRVSNVQVDDLLSEFQKALDDDKARRLQCEANLDAKIGYSQNPRLKAVLVLFGIIGDGALFLPLREPPRPRGPVPVKADQAPAKPLDETVVSAAAALKLANPETPAPEVKTTTTGPAPAEKPAVPATYEASTVQPAAKDRASFK